MSRLSFHKLTAVSAQLLSAVCYPMLMPVWAMLLLCAAVSRYAAPLPAAYTAFVIGGTALFCFLVPLLVVLLLIRQGVVTDLYINNSRERTLPYVYSLVSMLVWVFFLWRVVKMPAVVTLMALAGTMVLALVALINRWWKISVHLAAFGGLTGAVCGYCWHASLNPTLLISLLFIGALLLMLARLRLNAHTPLQLVCGYLLGLCLTFLPALFC